MKIKPSRGLILVKETQWEERSNSGLYLVSTASLGQPRRGLVVALGESGCYDNGTTIPHPVSLGETVLFASNQEMFPETKDENDNVLVFLGCDDVMAVLEGV